MTDARREGGAGERTCPDCGGKGCPQCDWFGVAHADADDPEPTQGPEDGDYHQYIWGDRI